MRTEILMLIVGVLAAECTEIAPWLAKRLVRWSAHMRSDDPNRNEVRAEEFEALIDAHPGKLFKLATALLFTIRASTAWLHRTGAAWLRKGIARLAVAGGPWRYPKLLKALDEVIVHSRALAQLSSDELPKKLLSRSLVMGARLRLERHRAVEALPLAQEAVTLSRQIGGASLVTSLACLAEVFERLQRYSEAAAALTEAASIPSPPALSAG